MPYIYLQRNVHIRRVLCLKLIYSLILLVWLYFLKEDYCMKMYEYLYLNLYTISICREILSIMFQINIEKHMQRYVPLAILIGRGEGVIINIIYLKIAWLITNRILCIKKTNKQIKTISWVRRVESSFSLIIALLNVRKCSYLFIFYSGEKLVLC